MTIFNPMELRSRGLQILIRELGYADAMRFMLQFETGKPGSDYARDRDQMLPDWSPEEMIRRSEMLFSEEGDSRDESSASS